MKSFAPRIALVVCLCAPAVAAPVPKALKKPTDPLVGEWKEMVADPSGKPTDAATGYTWRFEADGAAAVVWPNGTVVAAQYKLDAAQSPAGYDWTLPRHNARFAGVYELDGDTLRTATVSAGRERPTEAKPGSAVEYRVYVRVTPTK